MEIFFFDIAIKMIKKNIFEYVCGKLYSIIKFDYIGDINNDKGLFKIIIGII